MRANPGRLILYTDGSINPERSGAGVIACNTRGEILEIANKTLPMMTNNEAEYEGLLLAFHIAARRQATEIEIRMDSEIIVGQMSGRFAVNSPRLKPLHSRACELARQFQWVQYVHVLRHLNALADALASEASDGRRWRGRFRGE